MSEQELDYTVFKAALSVLSTAIVGNDKVGANDILTEWAARKIKVAVPFGKDFVILEVKARHKVGHSEQDLRYVARLAYRRLGYLIGLVNGVTARGNGQVISVKTEVDGMEIKVSIAGMRMELGELPLSHVPLMPAKPTYRDPDADYAASGVAMIDHELAKAGFTPVMLARMSTATKDAAFRDLSAEQAEGSEDFERTPWTPPGASYTTNRKRSRAEMEAADIAF